MYKVMISIAVNEIYQFYKTCVGNVWSAVTELLGETTLDGSPEKDRGLSLLRLSVS